MKSYAEMSQMELEAVADSFYCPVTYAIFNIPVALNCDGKHILEKGTAEKLINEKKSCPCCRGKISFFTLAKDKMQEVANFLQVCPQFKAEQFTYDVEPEMPLPIALASEVLLDANLENIDLDHINVSAAMAARQQFLFGEQRLTKSDFDYADLELYAMEMENINRLLRNSNVSAQLSGRVRRIINTINEIKENACQNQFWEDVSFHPLFIRALNSIHIMLREEPDNLHKLLMTAKDIQKIVDHKRRWRNAKTSIAPLVLLSLVALIALVGLTVSIPVVQVAVFAFCAFFSTQGLLTISSLLIWSHPRHVCLFYYKDSYKTKQTEQIAKEMKLMARSVS